MSGELPYDPEARRDTPLTREMKRHIAEHGPIPLSAFMRSALEHDAHGYYRSRTAIGRAGDFITAPEISQTFGELVGLWSAVVWQQMGRPSEFDLIELGPGRGTLLTDALRASSRVPGFHAAMRVVLHDIGPQAELIGRGATDQFGTPVECISSWPDIVDRKRRSRPSIVIANEFLDTRAPTSAIWRSGQLLAYGVGLGERGELEFTTLPDPLTPTLTTAARTQRYPDGQVFENWQTIASVTTTLARDTCAMLFIDYGHVEARPGLTLQAVRDHRYEHPLTSPGEADLSVQVAFACVADAFRAASLTTDGPVTQGAFLAALGIVERASRLMAANPAQANVIETGVARLIAPGGMGTRFKVLGVRSPNLPPLPGFPVGV